MLSKKTLTPLLVVVILVLSYQTYALAAMAQKLEDVSLGFGASQVSANVADGGSAPNMVGGC
ncbi:hypothetical protein HZA41_01505 [Candidatus Peregrinibacteria bacterium]|nr:hypothetical protein [Candidatus Peregrinibacteria bacterium]